MGRRNKGLRRIGRAWRAWRTVCKVDALRHFATHDRKEECAARTAAAAATTTTAAAAAAAATTTTAFPVSTTASSASTARPAELLTGRRRRHDEEAVQAATPAKRLSLLQALMPFPVATAADATDDATAADAAAAVAAVAEAVAAVTEEAEAQAAAAGAAAAASARADEPPAAALDTTPPSLPASPPWLLGEAALLLDSSALDIESCVGRTARSPAPVAAALLTDPRSSLCCISADRGALRRTTSKAIDLLFRRSRRDFDRTLLSYPPCGTAHLTGHMLDHALLGVPTTAFVILVVASVLSAGNTWLLSAPPSEPPSSPPPSPPPSDEIAFQASDRSLFHAHTCTREM